MADIACLNDKVNVTFYRTVENEVKLLFLGVREYAGIVMKIGKKRKLHKAHPKTSIYADYSIFALICQYKNDMLIKIGSRDVQAVEVALLFSYRSTSP